MKILVVDDEAEIRSSMQENLERNGYRVLTAENGIEAVDRARGETPDLILLDLMLPALDGYRVLKLLKSDERYQKIPILVITAKADVEDWALAEECGADDCMVKPVRPNDLLEKIERWLSRAEEAKLNAGES